MGERQDVAPRRSLPDYFYRLPPHLQNCYLKSESIDQFEGFAPTGSAVAKFERLVHALNDGQARDVEESAAQLMAELCRVFGVRSIRVAVRGVRPRNLRGELHGLFQMTRPPRIILWMRTAQRHKIVKPKTFLRTLLHELCHYLDYSLLELEDSFHTMGFFRRESFLVRSLMGSEGNPATP